MIMERQFRRVYVDVIAKFDLNGNVLPIRIIWSDGRSFEIDRVLDVRQAASLKAGGQGDRYLIRIAGREKYLFFERSTNKSGKQLGRWFVAA